ncbi:DNA mismatch repair protein Mlh1 [Scaptodrosophila lebanonensis]|uniref:DNA mismatch repair protein Mlh1 n=1 Tax=Drosophila lebanonensis TaxID=7225 RepID=A0A6J2UHJ1_DROLE|nr:DNA mismatch repair protein Mlh1 [Scaptodrosophila lebanonensis]
MQEPGVIKRLDEAVVNRIAAGEIIQRPANALKELLENSLDAKSNYIQVTIKSGGLKLLQIQDNGTGIRKEDLAIVCERFTTSKLNKFEDLTEIATFGFRGEALASISHVAHLTIQTKTAQERCGYKASYADSKLLAAPKPCAGNQGTIITIEDLFYNMPQRRQVLKSPAEEQQKVSDVLSKYAVHNPHVGFTLKRHGEPPSVKTQAGTTRAENIRLIYGAAIAKELLEFTYEDALLRFEVHCLMTQVNYAAKKGMLLLFINERLVESAPLKGAVDAVYASYLPKGSHPFVYMSLKLPPHNIDVNVHPTKHEVHFLYEDEIIEKLKGQVEAQLLGSNATRSFYKQLKLPGVAESEEDTKEKSVMRIYDKDLVRTDSREQKLDKFLQPLVQNVSGLSGSSMSSSEPSQEESFRQIAARKSKEVRLSSVLDMQQKLEHQCHVQLRSMLKQLVYVGCVDARHSLFQYETRLYMCDMFAFGEELFYQRLVYEFQNCAQITVTPPLAIKELLLVALDSAAAGWTAEDGDKQELATSATGILQEKAPIMKEYFSLRISEDGYLESLPALLPKHMPSKAQLPLYLLRLATEVEWEQEAPCFETFCRETARYYAQVEFEDSADVKKQRWQVEHVMYPAFKKFLLPPQRLNKKLYELTSLSKLYKVFERC